MGRADVPNLRGENARERRIWQGARVARVWNGGPVGTRRVGSVAVHRYGDADGCSTAGRRCGIHRRGNTVDWC